MERELAELRVQIANMTAANESLKAQLESVKRGSNSESAGGGDGGRASAASLSTDHLTGPSHEAVTSLLDLRAGFDGSGYMKNGNQFKRIEDVVLAADRISDLFNLFFTFYHPFLPFLDRDITPDEYYSTSPLLFWMIVSVGARRYQADVHLLNSLAGPVTRLVWSTLADIPQSYHVVKALCLLCTWPFPMSSTSTDPTFMLCGIMMQVAIQLGLHRPSHTRDFSKFRVELMESELRDKVRTWAICNTVAQRVATGYGQPASTLYDWTLGASQNVDANFQLPPDIRARLQIEQFSDKVTKALYSSRRDPVGLLGDLERAAFVSFLSRDFDDLESQLRQDDAITDLFLYASNLHLHLSAFFDDPSSKGYRERLQSLHAATVTFLEAALNLETNVGPVLTYTPYYIFQMMLAGGFALMKLCKSFFAAHIDLDYSKALFNRTIWAIRAISVCSNDLPERLAEVLAQMWKSGGGPPRRPPVPSSSDELDDSLPLKVRCRLSMSLVYDSVWRWREDALAEGRNIDASLKNPTDPASNSDSCVPSAAQSTRDDNGAVDGGDRDPSLAPPPSLSQGLAMSSSAPSTSANAASGLPSGSGFSIAEAQYEVFDPLNWLLDGSVEFPYAYPPVQGLETHSMA
ncbi:hypothetical protein VTN31DRAFT_4564 [Thermomyces dupontii]|uniref:uncharacterized protein n=1 Tax=Talaromyces thermophilus TaxID=28565 RepID=UPI003742C6C7